MYCENCGHKIDDDSIFCCECGVRVEEDPLPSYSKPKTYIKLRDAVSKFSSFFDAAKPKVSAFVNILRAFLPTKKGKITIVVFASVLIASVALPVLFCSNGKADDQNSDLHSDFYPDYSEDDLLSADSGSKRNLKWLLAPEIQADDIQVLYCGYPVVYDSGTEDINSIAKHKYDRISLIQRDGSYGLINYNGGIVTGMACDQIVIGRNQQYVMISQSGDNEYYYTLSSRYETTQIDESELFIDYLPDRTYYCWIDSFFGFCTYIHDVLGPYHDGFFGQVAIPYYDDNYVFQGYKVISNGEPINDIVYDGAGAFFGGIVPVCLDGKWGYLNADGEQILPFEFDAPLGWDLVNFSECSPPYNASDGYIVVYKNGEYAMYDSSGNMVIDFGLYEELRPVYEGMCWAKYDGKWGVLAIEDDAYLPGAVLPDHTVPENIATVYSNSGLRMREGPGTDYCVVSILSDGEKITVCGYTEDWSYIRKGNLYGWVKTEYIE